MVDSNFFDKLEAVARALRKKEIPFGGIQLILSGDFLQLPPVVKQAEKKKFCFQVRKRRRTIIIEALTFETLAMSKSIGHIACRS